MEYITEIVKYSISYIVSSFGKKNTPDLKNQGYLNKNFIIIEQKEEPKNKVPPQL